LPFNSVQYAVFLPSVIALYWLLRTPRRQNLLLLVASYVFYGAWDWRFLGLLSLSTIVDYVVGRGLGRTQVMGQRKALLLVSVVTNLGILGTFKYFGFFVDSATVFLDRVGLAPTTSVLDIVLPVGISFYTFQTMSYTIDVYRRRQEPTGSFLDFAVFVAYFPQLVAGPIERATRLLPQITARRRAPSRDAVRSGLALILLGLFKKVAIADAVAPIADAAFDGSADAGWATLLLGVYAFAVQIYCDFSGYSDIARGSSRLMGIELMRNFEQPYLARNITDFWRTWHISLSSWLRDYLYISLGGNRKGPTRTQFNLAAVMLLGGLWHGAAWTFVVWGGLHGLYLAADRRRSQLRTGSPNDPVGLRDVPAILGTFHAVCLAWVFFRAEGFGQAWEVLSGLATLRGGDLDISSALFLAAAATAIVAIDLAQRRSGRHVPSLGWPAPLRGALVGMAATAIIVFSGGTAVPFIYFQF
jgi:D-alanyl-lipoteichoic acid acyltransferase DltB (MBOAT superfamily)